MPEMWAQERRAMEITHLSIRNQHQKSQASSVIPATELTGAQKENKGKELLNLANITDYLTMTSKD